MSGLGYLISAEGKKVSLSEVVRDLRRGLRPDPGLRSRGFEIARVSIKFRSRQLPGVKTGKVRTLSREDIMLEEIGRYAKNKPMIIIGVIMILIEREHAYQDISPVDLCDLLVESGFLVTLTEVKRVMRKIDESALLDLLVSGKRIGLQKAYQLYR